MPIYEYRCEACEHTLDALQKISDDPLKDCPACGDPSLKRLISAPAFRLKGGGWYETDFKSDKEKKRNLADAPKSESATAKPASTAGKDSGGKSGAGGSAKSTGGSGTEAA